MTPTIRFPSRFLDRTLASKRKRWGSPDTAPKPKDKSYGLGEAESYGSSEEDGVTEQQPGKLRRTSKSADFSSQAAGNPDKARPYTWSMYEKSTIQYKGGNVFSEYYAFRKAEEAGAKRSDISQQCPAKTPIPITNSAGTFKVPSPGDSDWSNSESEEEEEDLRPSEPPRPQQIINAYEEWCKTASPAVLAAVERMEVDPNLAGNAFEEAITNAGPAGRENFNAYEEWCKTASPAVLAVLGTMVVDASLAGDAFKGGLGDFAAAAKGAAQVVP